MPLTMAVYDPTEFQTAIYEWLDRTGLSQNAAAGMCDVSQGAFNRWLKPAGDRRLTKPDPETLQKLAPHMRIRYEELMRMTGRQATTPAVATKNPRELQALIRHLEAAWEHVEPARREFGAEQVRNMFPLHQRTRKPREGRSPEQPDDPFSSLLTHKSVVLAYS